MYPAIQANIDRIAQEAYDLWRSTGRQDVTDALIDKRLKEFNMTDWASSVTYAMAQMAIKDYQGGKFPNS